MLFRSAVGVAPQGVAVGGHVADLQQGPGDPVLLGGLAQHLVDGHTGAGSDTLEVTDVDAVDGAHDIADLQIRIEAAGDYMCIYTADNSLILRETMKDLERRLDPRVFQRVHRSWIVNLNLVRQVKPHTNGECFLILESGADVKVSRSYRDVVARFVH